MAAVAVALGVVIGRYGFFGDELYFLAAGRRLDWGYADQGPLLPLLARLADLVAPGSVVALRIPALLITVAGVGVTALIAREFGGGRVAQVMSAGAYGTCMFLVAQGHLLATNTVDSVLWVVITWLLVRWVRTRSDDLLLWLGVVTAVDLQVKFLIPLFWVAVAVGVLVFGPRELLRRPKLWIGAAIAVVATLPSLFWQANNGWPQLKMGEIISAEQSYVGGRFTFLPLALASAGALGAVLICYAMWRLFRADSLRQYRFLGLAVVIVTIGFLVANGRSYYVAGLYGVLFAIGVVEFGRRRHKRWFTVATVLLFVGSAVFTVTSLPITPVDRLRPAATITDAALDLSLYGQFGWPELTDKTAAAYRALPAAERARTVLVAESYWQASALDEFGPGRGLPSVYSPSRGFHYFGVPPNTATTVLYVGSDQRELSRRFGSVQRVSTVDVALGMQGATKDVTVWRASQPKQPWSRMWPCMLKL